MRREGSVWDEYAVHYDRILTRLPFYVAAVRRHLEALAAEPAGNLLDIGAGTGSIAVPLASMGWKVTAVDVSRGMLERLLSKLSGDESGEVRVLEGKAESLPDWEVSFDAVNILLALFDMDDPRAVLQRTADHLRPGGLLVVTEPLSCFDLELLRHEGEKALREQEVLEALQESWHRVININRAIDPAFRDPLFAEEIEKMLRASCFSDITLYDSHHGTCETIIARKSRR
jgi:ubiquinone/menaquinone biosynthesis C-methylase UbiE